MARFMLACSLLAALTTSAVARAVDAPTQFARPPVAELDEPAVPAPVRTLDRDVVSDRVLDRDVVSDRVLDRAAVRAAVRAKLIANRATNVANFRAYVKRGVFPSNTYRDGKLNVWIDAAGNRCAAATMLTDWGLEELVTRVAEQNNFIRLKDVRQGPLMDWILMSGLTQDEIVAIQEPGFMVREPLEPKVRPAPPIVVDAGLRRAEDVRLARRYKQVDAMIAKNHKRSIEIAVDRLMKSPELAWQLIDG